MIKYKISLIQPAPELLVEYPKYGHSIKLEPVYMILLTRDEMKGGTILMYWNKSRLMIQQNITIFLGVDYLYLETKGC